MTFHLTAEQAQAIEAIAERRMAWLATRTPATLYDRQCIAKAYNHQHDIKLAAVALQDHLAGHEGFETAEDELFDLIGGTSGYSMLDIVRAAESYVPALGEAA